MKAEPAPNLSPASTPPGGSNHLLEYMKAHGLPLTRENYLDRNFPDGVPDPMPAELEMEIPRIFRLEK